MIYRGHSNLMNLQSPSDQDGELRDSGSEIEIFFGHKIASSKAMSYSSAAIGEPTALLR
jgi:hypothetical protein